MNRPRVRKAPPCPICASWACRACGHHVNRVDGRLPYSCPNCGSTDGRPRPIVHNDRDVHDEHVARAKIENSVRPYDRERVHDVAALAVMLKPMIDQWAALGVEARGVPVGSHHHNRLTNHSLSELEKIDSTIRSWVADHPLEGDA